MIAAANNERDTRQRVRSYVTLVSVAAVLSAYFLFRFSPVPPPGAWSALGLLTLLAIIGEAWAFLLPQSATTSIAFIPYMAMALIVPHWTTVAVIGVLRVADEVRRRNTPIKAIFNLAQFVLVFSLTVLMYRALGGVSFLTAPLGIAALTRDCGWAAIGAYALSVVINIGLTSSVIALASDRPFIAVWRENHAPSLGLDLIAAPITFGFAFVYTDFGPIAAALLWIPLVGFRHWAKTTVDLAQTNRELLELMIKSIEARDTYTSGHSRRVQHYAVLIARCLGLGEREVAKVGTAALLHDVGKIYEKYGPILRKGDKLDPAEWVVMKEHPIDGADLVSTMTGLTEFVPAVRHHHENWNGTGYPDGLAGDEIPLASRIIMFADTIDAMTTERPYRGPLGEPEVRSELLRRRAEQFDPAIVDILLASPVWEQLFSPAHRAARNYRLSLIGAPEHIKLEA